MNSVRMRYLQERVSLLPTFTRWLEADRVCYDDGSSYPLTNDQRRFLRNLIALLQEAQDELTAGDGPPTNVAARSITRGETAKIRATIED